MSTGLSTGTGTSTSGGLDPAVILKAFTDAARVLVPFARMYIGPAVAVVESGIERDRGEVDRQILMLAFNKAVLEAGTLPAPGAAYAPHTTAFTIDPQTRMGNALDLPYVLGALRGLSVWAAAGPAPVDATAASRAATSTGATASLSTAAAVPATSTRDLRLAARARGLSSGATATRSSAARRAPTGGCGCSGGAAPAASFSTSSAAASSLSSAASRTGLASRRSTRRADCRDPRPHCDCNMTCGGRSCGCNGTTSCTDCIPRGASAGDRCACGTCTPPAPVTCEPWTPSCETRNRLRTALREAVCDVLACFELAMCPAGTLDPAALQQWPTHLARCFADVFCKLLRALREALCPPPPVVTPPSVSPAIDCLPCSYAVEDLR